MSVAAAAIATISQSNTVPDLGCVRVHGGAFARMGIGLRELRKPNRLPVMVRILITGMSGAGKTTVLEELSRRGYLTIDTDCDGWVLPDGTWDEPRMSALLASNPFVVVSGTVGNQGSFYGRFSAVVLLSAPVEVLIDRVSNRTNNPYGNSLEDQAAIRRYVLDVEPLLRNGATLELDGRRPVSDLADEVERLTGGHPIAPAAR